MGFVLPMRRKPDETNHIGAMEGHTSPTSGRVTSVIRVEQVRLGLMWAAELQVAAIGSGYGVSVASHDLIQNEALVQRFYGELWNRWQLSLADEIVSDALRFRGSSGTECEGRDEFKRYVRTVRAAFPDLHNRIDEILGGLLSIERNFD
jgi:hypothetical protein